MGADHSSNNDNNTLIRSFSSFSGVDSRDAISAPNEVQEVPSSEFDSLMDGIYPLQEFADIMREDDRTMGESSDLARSIGAAIASANPNASANTSTGDNNPSYPSRAGRSLDNIYTFTGDDAIPRAGSPRKRVFGKSPHTPAKRTKSQQRSDP